MDQFFQTLRKIQKKERNNSSLARVDDDFYKNIQHYLDELRASTGNDPFSEEQYLLKDTQRIATEICERREHKITDAAVVNIHRSYHLFTGKPQFDLVDTTPLNLTNEEEKFYFSMIDVLTNHRRNIALEKLTDDETSNKEIKKISNPLKESKTSNKDIKRINKPLKEIETSELKEESDEVLSKLNKIKNAKVITDEKVEPIEKQIATSKKTFINEENVSAIYDNVDDQFVDFESRKIAKAEENETLLVFDDINPIIAVDEKVYGPFRPQDLVVMPKINARIFVKNRKGRIIKI